MRGFEVGVTSISITGCVATAANWLPLIAQIMAIVLSICTSAYWFSKMLIERAEYNRRRENEHRNRKTAFNIELLSRNLSDKQ